MVKTPSFWSKVATSGENPPNSCCHSLVEYKNNLVLFGGGVIGRTMNSLYNFDLHERVWTQIKGANQAMIQPRLSHTAVVIENKMLVFGGMEPLQLSADTFVFNFDTLSWHVFVPKSSSSPPPRRSHTAVVYEGRMYILMGAGIHMHYSDFWVLDWKTQEWRLVGDDTAENRFGRPPVGLSGHSAVVIRDFMYIFGGMNEASTYTNAVHRYHFPANRWEEVQISSSPWGRPAPRYSQVCWFDAQHLYIHGGDSQLCTVYYDDVWRLNLTSGEWTDMTTEYGGLRPCTRSGHVAVGIDGVLYMFGGECPGNTTTVKYSAALYQLCYAYPCAAPLVELAARWLAVSQIVNPANGGNHVLFREEPGIPLNVMSAIRRYRSDSTCVVSGIQQERSMKTVAVGHLVAL